MTIPREIQHAVQTAVTSADQPEAVASRLIAWLEALNAGNESLTDEESVRRHLDLLFQTVALPETEDGN